MSDCLNFGSPEDPDVMWQFAEACRGLKDACLELGITHIESLCNLESLIGQGTFRFIGLPLKWRGGTGSPIRAVAVFED